VKCTTYCIYLIEDGSFMKKYSAGFTSAGLFKQEIREVLFSGPFGKTALAVLWSYPSPRAVREADTDVLTLLISKTSRKGLEWASNKVAQLRDCAQLASSMPSEFSLLDTKIKFHIDGIEHMQASLDGIEAQIHKMIDSKEFPAEAKRNVELLDEIPGVGFLTVATLIAEIGSPKALTAFFGLDPSVNQSGKFNGDRNKISKRGTRIGRRILFTIAMASIRATRNGKEINPVLREFYTLKCVSKKKKVALVAVMHKLLHYIFAVLRDQEPFVIKRPEDHQTWWATKPQPAIA